MGTGASQKSLEGGGGERKENKAAKLKMCRKQAEIRRRQLAEAMSAVHRANLRLYEASV